VGDYPETFKHALGVQAGQKTRGGGQAAGGEKGGGMKKTKKRKIRGRGREKH